MADRLDESSNTVITDEALKSAYEFLERTLGESGVVATAAFVTSFAVPYEALREQLGAVQNLAELHPGWYRYLLPRLSRGDLRSLRGLQGHGYWSALLKAGHEIGYHGATHLPLSAEVKEAAARAEVTLGESLWPILGAPPTTVIFPRNEVGHLDLHHRHGLRSYRPRRTGGTVGRVVSLIRELNVVDGGESDYPYHADGWNVSTPGFFLNWGRGARRLVPDGVTVRRWRSMLRAAVVKGRHVHMWFHPHNLITYPPMRGVLRNILCEVSALVRSGDLKVKTMSELQYHALKR